MVDIKEYVRITQALEQFGFILDPDDTPPIIYGEVNDGVNIGVGEGEIYGGKIGPTLQFRTLEAGSGITITTEENEILFTATGTGTGNVVGTPPSIINSLAIYPDGSGLVIDDIPIRYAETTGSIRSLEGLEANGTSNWYHLISTNWESPNGFGGDWIEVGDEDVRLELHGSTISPYYAAPGTSGLSPIIHQKSPQGWQIDAGGTVSADGHTTPILTLESTGTGAADSQTFVSSGDPNGVITGNPGDVCRVAAGVNSSVYVHVGASTSNSDWSKLGNGPAICSRWQFDTSTADSDPGAGYFRFSSGTQHASTYIYISRYVATGEDVQVLISNLRFLDRIGICDEGGSTYFIFRVTSDPTISGNYLRIPVFNEAYSGSLSADAYTIHDWFTLGRVTGPATSFLNGFPKFTSTDGREIGNSWFRQDADTNEHYIQGIDAQSYTTWRNMLGQYYEEPNGQPGGQQVHVGNTSQRLAFFTSSTGPILYAPGHTGYANMIHEYSPAGWSIRSYGNIVSQAADTVPVLRLASTGTGGASTYLYVGNSDPQTRVTASPGSIFIEVNGISSAMHIHEGAATSNNNWKTVNTV